MDALLTLESWNHAQESPDRIGREAKIPVTGGSDRLEGSHAQALRNS
jgi:hypothetical protein